LPGNWRGFAFEHDPDPKARSARWMPVFLATNAGRVCAELTLRRNRPDHDCIYEFDRDRGDAMYALFDGNTQIGRAFPTEKEVWEAALIDGLVTDVPVADEAGGQILPAGYHVAQIEQRYDGKPEWKLPREIS
jgi:hypothetical protein